jgi:hypothetical protein
LTRSAEETILNQNQDIFILGTQTVTEVKAEAPDNDPSTRSYYTIPS